MSARSQLKCEQKGNKEGTDARKIAQSSVHPTFFLEGRVGVTLQIVWGYGAAKGWVHRGSNKICNDYAQTTPSVHMTCIKNGRTFPVFEKTNNWKLPKFIGRCVSPVLFKMRRKCSQQKQARMFLQTMRASFHLQRRVYMDEATEVHFWAASLYCL